MGIKNVLVWGCLTLVGCASNQQFDCPVKGGIRCQSMQEIEKMIDTGKLGEPKTPQQKQNVKHYVSASSPLRTSEEVMEVWVAPYESNDGVYHHAALLDMVLKPAAWRK